MKLSKTHLKFSHLLNTQDVLNHPENYIGPNWDSVLNFWLHLDKLTEDQLNVVQYRYRALSFPDGDMAYYRANNAANDTTDYANWAGDSASFCVLCANAVAKYATFELIGLNELLKKGQNPVYFPMFCL
jgi:hypothetical protein